MRLLPLFLFACVWSSAEAVGSAEVVGEELDRGGCNNLNRGKITVRGNTRALCGFCAGSSTLLNFRKNQIKTNNLGGLGPRGGPGGQCIWWTKIGDLGGRSMDLIMSAVGSSYGRANARYKRWGRSGRWFAKRFHGVLKQGGGSAGSMKAGNYHFKYRFIYTGTNSPAQIDYLPLTYYDLDGGKEFVRTNHAVAVAVAKPTGMARYGCARRGGGYHCYADGARREYRFPRNLDRLSRYEKMASVTFLFRQRSTFVMNYKTTYDHRVFLFRGTGAIMCKRTVPRRRRSSVRRTPIRAPSQRRRAPRRKEIRRRAARRNCRAGWKGELFYRGGMRSLPHMGNRRPNKVAYDRYVNIRSSGRGWKGARGDHFVVRWTGQLHIKRSGRYKFCLNSDDGSKMYLNGGLVVNNDGLHGMRTRCGSKKLRGGSYKVKVAVFEHGGGFGCIWKYHGADTGNRYVLVGQNSGSISQCRRKPKPRRNQRRRRNIRRARLARAKYLAKLRRARARARYLRARALARARRARRNIRRRRARRSQRRRAAKCGTSVVRPRCHGRGCNYRKTYNHGGCR